MHVKKITKSKTNGDLLSKKKILKEYRDVLDTTGFLSGKLHLEVDFKIYKKHTTSTARAMEDISCNEGGNNEKN